MNCRLSIGIVTYLRRFETYFKPLIRKISFLFPDYDTVVFVNGHFDKQRQIQYLRDLTAFLRKYPGIRYVTYEDHQALARGWNWLVMMAKCDRILILNDDVSFNAEFRYNLEHLPSVPDVFTINGSFSHFVISKNVIRQVGWFDERFVGVGDEDSDYILRLAMKGVELPNLHIRGLFNYIARDDQCGWSNISGVVHGKYSEINRECLKKKWSRSDYGPVPSNSAFQVIYKGEVWNAALNEPPDAMPEYYPMTCLDAGEPLTRGGMFCVSIIPKTVGFLSFLYWTMRMKLGSWLRTQSQP